jgi:hypothetical protein
MDCVCVPFRGLMGKTKYCSAFERGMVVGARHTGLSVSRTATLLGFSLSNIPCVYQEWSTSKRHPANMTQLWEALESTWASITVEHLVESMP